MRRGFGRGLSQLRSEGEPSTAPKRNEPKKIVTKTPRAVVSISAGNVLADLPVTELSIDSIRVNQNQPRTSFDQSSLSELADSIREVGILQPIVVRKIKDDQYEIIAGERRWRAAQLAELSHVPVHVRNSSPQLALELALIENIQREDISAIESAIAYQQLSEQYGQSPEDIAKRVGKSRSTVANTLRLLRLPNEIQQGLRDGLVTEGQTRPLLALRSAEEQHRVYRKILEQSLSARQVEVLVKALVEGASPKETKTPKGVTVDPNWKALERGFNQFFGTRTSLQKTKKGGRITIEFANEDDLQRIVDALGIGL